MDFTKSVGVTKHFWTDDSGVTHVIHKMLHAVGAPCCLVYSAGFSVASRTPFRLYPRGGLARSRGSDVQASAGSGHARATFARNRSTSCNPSQLRFALGQELLSSLDKSLLSLDASLGALHELQTNPDVLLPAARDIASWQSPEVLSEILRLGCRLPTSPKRPGTRDSACAFVMRALGLFPSSACTCVDGEELTLLRPLQHCPTLQNRGLPPMH